jgi:E3 ubiquitin-protein ligase HUWE1
MSRASSKNKEDVKKDASISSGSDDEEEVMEDGGREETPDVYRHSALGIYAGVSIIWFIFVTP